MFAALNEQDMLCRVFGDCRHGDRARPRGRRPGRRERAAPTPKLFTYLRYNAELSPQWLADRGLDHVAARDVQRLDSTKHMAQLQEIGRSVGADVQDAHFQGFA